MTAEQLQEHENRGRLFASALLDVGFTDQEVRDAAWGPVWRIRQEDKLFHTDIRTWGSSSDTYRIAARREIGAASVAAMSLAFVTGVLATLETRA
jgi:hypothetical protein